MTRVRPADSDEEEEAGFDLPSEASFSNSSIFKLLSDVDAKTLKKVRECVSNGDDVNLTGKYDESYLHMLCTPISVDQVQHVVSIIYFLVNAGCDVNWRDREGNTVLHVAVLNNLQLDICAAFLRLGVDPLEKNIHGETAAEMAANDELRDLIAYYSPGLVRAVKTSDVRLLRKLLGAWCIIDVNGTGRLLEDLARMDNNPRVYESLKEMKLTSQVVLKALSGDHKELKQLLKENGEKVKVDVKDGYIASMSGRSWPLLAEVLRLQLWDSAKVLIKHADVNIQVDGVEGKRFPLFEWVIKCVPDLKMSLLKTITLLADLSKVDALSLLRLLWKRHFAPELVETFFTAGFSLATRDEDGLSFRDSLLRESYTLDFPDLRKVLYCVDRHVVAAARAGDQNLLRELFLSGYDFIFVTDDDGRDLETVAREARQTQTAEFIVDLKEKEVRS